MYQNLAESSLTFPQKLFALMENESNDVVQWLSHGFSFRILDFDRFYEEIVPRYFKRECLNHLNSS
jgi:hypothetical protein